MVGVASKCRRCRTTVGAGHVGAVAAVDHRHCLIESAHARYRRSRRKGSAAIGVGSRLEGHDRRGAGFNRDALTVVAAVVVGVASKCRRCRTTVGAGHVGAVAAVDHRHCLIESTHARYRRGRRKGSAAVGVGYRLEGHDRRGARFFNRDALTVVAAVVVGVASKCRRCRTAVGAGHVGAVAAVDHRHCLIESTHARYRRSRRKGGAAVDVGSRLEGHDRRGARFFNRDALTVVAVVVVGVASKCRRCRTTVGAGHVGAVAAIDTATGY